MANSFMRRYIMDKRRGDVYDYSNGRGYNGYDGGSGQYEGEFRGGYENDRRRMDRMDDGRGAYFDDRYDMRGDGRRGVKYTGPYGIGGRRHYPRSDRAMYDGNDYAEEDMKLNKREIMEWKESITNADGTHGPHFEIAQIEQAAQTIGIQMRGFDLRELCVIANMLYSHFGELNKQLLPKEKEAIYYTRAAQKWLEDKDAKLHGSEKALVYFYDFVCDDEE